MMLMNDVIIAMTVQLQENERLIKEEREKHARAMDEREREINSLKQQLFNRQEQFNNLSKELSVMFEDNEDIRTDINNLKSSVFVPPYSFIVRDFHSLQSSSKQWFSQPFYTHINGYKMCISVDCNGSDEGAGSHVSVYANLMCGEFDDQLNWPFCGSILIRLKNQFSDKNHIEHDIPFSRDVSAEIGGRVTNQELAESGLGVPRFVSLKELNYDSFTGVGYIKHNSLSFCVCSVRVANICV
jgi:TNF receptor-associated factor 4